MVDGVSPTFETVASGKYPASRPLFIYVKKAHIGVIPGINEFIAEYTSEKALGEEGYLADKGLIPPTKGEIGEDSRPTRRSLKARSSSKTSHPRTQRTTMTRKLISLAVQRQCWPRPRVSRRRRHSRRAPRSKR